MLVVDRRLGQQRHSSSSLQIQTAHNMVLNQEGGENEKGIEVMTQSPTGQNLLAKIMQERIWGIIQV